MPKNEPEKVDLKSKDIAEDQKQKLREVFPNVFNENKIDFDRLKLALGEDVDTAPERYGMTWPGKTECMRIIQQPSIGTLKPAKKESVDFDATENVFVEGDNLEVLKLLQNSYYGKIKMIYIDPPYNTGKEFIYPDKFSESLETYLLYTGQVDADGKRFSTNTEADGRFHSKWLNMMYPRLYLARNLLRDDGVIFISIDDNEASNLRKMCDDIFGESCFVADVCVVNNLKGRNDKKYIATANERVLMYVKTEEFNEYGLELSARMVAEYKGKDESGAFRLIELRKRGGPDTRAERPRMYYPFFVDPKSGSVALEMDKIHTVKALPVKSNGVDGRWRWGKDTAEKNLEFLYGSLVQGSERYNIYEKDYLEQDGDARRIKPKSVMAGAAYSTDGATKAYRALMGAIDFDNPKPVQFIQDLIAYSASPDSSPIILDFFSGSATTAHAALELNCQDGGNRQFILVQLPELCAADSEAFKAGYKNIAEIAKERIRRAIQKLKKDQKTEKEETLFVEKKNGKPPDLGFKVFKLAKSNFKIWEGAIDKKGASEDIKKQLEFHIDHVDPKATADDILYELLLKSGFPLTTEVEERILGTKKVYSVEGNALLICLEKELTKEVITEMARLEPARVICLDQGFARNDQLKTNAVQIMKSHGVNDFRTV